MKKSNKKLIKKDKNNHRYNSENQKAEINSNKIDTEEFETQNVIGENLGNNFNKLLGCG